MAKQSTSGAQGTFAQLYDVHEELSRRNIKPLGRPPKKVKRKPTTIHLTQSESRNLSRMQLLVNDQISVNRSELVGLAIDVLTAVMDNNGEELLQDIGRQELDVFRQRLFDFMKL